VTLPPSTEVVRTLEDGAKGFFRFLPRLITIMESLQLLSKTVEKQDEEIQALRQRLDRLEAREDLYLAKIEAAAAKATADMAGRLGRIEGMVEARDRRG